MFKSRAVIDVPDVSLLDDQIAKVKAVAGLNLQTLTDAKRKQDDFEHFRENRPSGKIDQRFIKLGCNTALDAGLYTFTFAKTGAVVKARYSYTYENIGGQWLITSHHSSAMPEK